MLDAVEADMQDASQLVKDQERKQDTNGASIGEINKDVANDVGLKEDAGDGPLDLGDLPPRKELGIQGLLDAFVESKEEEFVDSEGRIVL